MSIEKLPNYQPILVRPEGDNIMPGGKEIEVWQTQPGSENRGRVPAYSQNTIMTQDKDGANYEAKLRGQHVSVSEAYGRGQDALAAEYADLPLRTDTILAEINGKVVDAKVYDYVSAEDGTLFGAVIEEDGTTTVLSIDVLRGEYQKQLRTVHQGEAVLRAAELKEPGVNPWSQEAAKLRDEKSAPTFENPHMFDQSKDVIVPVQFSQVEGEILQGDRVGWFKKGSEMYYLVELTAESRRKSGFKGEYMSVPSELTSGVTVTTSEKNISSEINEENNEHQSEPEAAKTDPFDELPPEVQADVRQYRDAVQSKRDAERDGRYDDAADDGRWIYAVGKRISKQAQEFVNFRL